MRTPAFERFVEPARRKPQFWRLMVGLILSFIVYAICIVFILFVVWLAIAPGPDPDFLWVERFLNAETPVSMLVLLTTFFGMALGPMLAVRWVHKRAARTLFGRGAVVLRHFFIAAGICSVVLAIAVVIWLLGNTPVPGLAPGTWLMFLPLSLACIALQTGAEEVLFRGYLQQQLAARFRSPVVWLILPSLIFGAAHYDPVGAGDNALLVVAAAALFGLLAADLTARSGSIGAAWGFHFANNTLALTGLATQGTLTGLALYQTPYSVSDVEALRSDIPADLVTMMLIWFLIRRATAR